MKINRLKVALLVTSLICSLNQAQANLIAYWPFDDGEGGIASDVIGGFDATINGGLWTTDAKVGTGAFEGAAGEEVVCDPTAIPSTDDLTLSWWMIDNQTSWGTVMDKSFTSANSGFVILVRPSNEDSPLRFRIGGWQAYGGWGAECRIPIDSYNEGEWVHITCVFDSGTDTASIYVNGELPENGDYNPKTGIISYCEGTNNTEAPLFLRGGFENFNGVLDDVAMWDRPLTPEEIMTVYESGPLAIEQPGVDLAVTDISYSSESREVTLTWNSIEGENYVVKYSSDLANWDSDLDDGVVGDAGESTTRTFDLSDLEESASLYFRVEKP